MTNRLRETARTDNAMAKRVIGLAMKVHRTLGCGFLEAIYANAFAIELRKAGLFFEREKKFSVLYDGIEIGVFLTDFVIERELIVELKAVDSLAVAHSVQLVNYLAAAKLENGLLLNFGTKSLEFKTKTRTYPINLEPPNLQS